MLGRALPFLALIACASTPAQPVAKDAKATTVSVAPVAAAPTALVAPPMPQPPPPPPKMPLAASDRIPIGDVVKAITAKRHVVVLGPRDRDVLADLKQVGFHGLVDAVPMRRGFFDEALLVPHDVVVADIDVALLDFPQINYHRTPTKWSPVIVRWRHRMGERFYDEPSFVDSRCQEAACDTFTIHGSELPREEWDFEDLPLVELDVSTGRPKVSNRR